MSRRQPPLLRFIWLRAVIAATQAFCIACFSFFGSPAYGLDPNKKLTQYIHKSWVKRDGGHSAYGITQTSDGFLWFTSGDMRTFDGIDFVSWDGPPNGGPITKGARFGQIVQVFGDWQGGLWVFGLKEIAHLKGRAVTSQLDLPGVRSLQNVFEAEDGSIWVVRGGNSISDQPLCHVTDRSFKCFGKADGIPISPVNSLLADGKGGFWLGGQTTLVHWHDGVSQSYPIDGLKSNVGQPGIAALAYGPDGSLWVGIFAPGPGKGLGRLINGAFQPFMTPAFDGSKVAVHGMAVDRDGNLWVASYGMGLFRIHGTDVDHFGRSEGLSSDTVNAVFVDREGLLWAGTTEGVDKFRDPPVATFTTVEGLGNDLANGVLADRDGTVWVSNFGSLDRIAPDGTVSSIRAANGLPGHRVTSMLEDRAGNLWVGIDDGLYLFKDRQFRRVPVPDGQPLGFVSGLAEDTDGNIWAACIGKPSKLVRIRDFRVVEILPDSQVPTGGTLASDPQGGIWIATSKGDLALFRRGVLQTFPLNTNGDPVIPQIAVQGDGSVLAGSANGLVALRNGKVDKLTTKNGLPCDFVTSFVKDRDQRWWLNADCGVVELADSELQRWWAAPQSTVRVRVYDEADGAEAGRPRFNAAAYSNRRVWFAQGNTVQMLDPAKLPEKSFPAATYIRSVTVDRNEFPIVDDLKIPPNPRDLQIDYTSPSFSTPQKIKFRYRLDGYDRDWRDAGTRRQAFYTDLPPGDYTFRVMAAHGEAVWNETPATLKVSVAAAYYQTNWFRALCAALLLAFLWLVYRLRVRHLQRRLEMTLELSEVRERFRVLAESASTGIYVTHMDRFSYVNPAYARIFGYTVEEILDGLGSLDLTCPEDRPMVAENMRRRLEGEVEELRYEFRGLRKDGSVFPAEVHGRRIKFDGKIGVLGTLIDNTDRKRAEEERERLRRLETELAHANRVNMLGELTTSIAHEVSQPLGAMVASAGACARWLAADPPAMTEARSALANIVADGKRARDVIARIRALAKRQAPRTDLLDVNRKILDVLSFVDQELETHNVVLATRLDNTLPKIMGDRVQLQQVILNLVKNAIEAMSGVNNRRRELTIVSSRLADGVVVEVRDCGDGFDADGADRLFDAFYTTKPDGLGVGLSISRTMIEAHGGRLWAAPNEPRGAVFAFSLPAANERQS